MNRFKQPLHNVRRLRSQLRSGQHVYPRFEDEASQSPRVPGCPTPPQNPMVLLRPSVVLSFKPRRSCGGPQRLPPTFLTITIKCFCFSLISITSLGLPLHDSVNLQPVGMTAAPRPLLSLSAGKLFNTKPNPSHCQNRASP
jgi:hypothetical protein